MKYPQEALARALFAELTQHFASTTPATDVSIKGAGVHWGCTVTRADLVCTITCFDYRGVTGYQGDEYCTRFNRDAQRLATGRTPDQDETIRAVADWLAGASLVQMYERYEFVDRRKRELTTLRENVGLKSKALSETTLLQVKFGDSYSLWFRSADRSCCLYYYGREQFPRAEFSWDDCELFRYQPVDDAVLADVLQRWICDRAQPSEMRCEFPFLKIGELADYYERGQPVEGEFLRSWNSIEKFYQQDWMKHPGNLLAMIAEMRAAGYDRLLRAGQSLATMGLSRSRRHGLRENQPRLWFEFRLKEGVMNVTADFQHEQLTDHPIRLTADVRRLLDALVQCEID